MATTPEANKDLEQLQNAEKKFQSYIERRNELNDYAKVLREERDMINAKHKDFKDKMKILKQERDHLVEEMRKHKTIRNQLQEKAKELIKLRRSRRGEIHKNLHLFVEELKADAQMLEYRQETVPMSPSDEKELVEKIREKKNEYRESLARLQEQETLQIEISDQDKSIDELFKKADSEHEIVQKFYNESQQKHEEYMKFVDELSITIAESNKKHEQYIEARNEAQSNHEKAMEMRGKIVHVKGERRRRWQEAKQIIKEQNIKARNAVMDKDKLNELADDSLEALKKGRKISL